MLTRFRQISRSSNIRSDICTFLTAKVFLVSFAMVQICHCSTTTSNNHIHVASGPSNNKLLREIQSQGQSHCVNAEKKLDECSQQLIMFGQQNAQYPASLVDLDHEFCPNFRRANNCVKKYSTCYKPFQRQIINWILISTTKANHKRCKNETEKARFVNLSSSCLIQLRNPMTSCMDRYIANLEKIAHMSGDSDRLRENDNGIQLSCCANRQFKQCLMENAKQSCSAAPALFMKRFNSVSAFRRVQKSMFRANSDLMDNFKRAIDSMALTGPEFICDIVKDAWCHRNYDSSKFEQPGVRPIHRSIVPSMIKIYSN
ncbi:hypothetical protein GZH46_00419 [Fragariocoptes setiger]|uniref:Uncharacterized protein n=1 Tax=Fragariocoptes setiger TaxID=1670756 RepID=A0ABQ7SCQ1_9ACAR|nr:hypothetical protein GZH46_00419 [Fragariocoptes setiger]